MDQDDALLERRAIAGDRAAFAELADRHWGAVYKTLHTLAGRPQDAEDLTQETFTRALVSMASFTPGTRLRNWLLRIAANAFFDLRRKRRRADVQTLDVEPPDPAAGQADVAETADQARLVRQAMEELPETTRLVFHLRATEDLSFRDIAEAVGTTEQSARQHMRKARIHLLARMEGKT